LRRAGPHLLDCIAHRTAAGDKAARAAATTFGSH
jgi:hypothetical protein